MPISDRAIILFTEHEAVTLSDGIKSLDVLPGLPVDQITLPTELEFLDNIGITQFKTIDHPDFTTLRTVLLFATELKLDLPGLEGFALVAGSTEGEGTEITLELDLGDGHFEFRIIGKVGLRFGRNVLKPARLGPNGWEEIPDKFSEISIDGDLAVDGDGNVSINSSGGFDLAPAMIGDTGFVIEARDITPILSSTIALPAGCPPEIVPGWRGVFVREAAIHLPKSMDLPIGNLVFRNCYIGSGGFTGEVSTTWPTPSAPRPTGTVLGAEFILSEIHVSFRQNALTQAEIIGKLTLPFFNEPVDVDIGIDLKGGLTAKLASGSGLYTLTKPEILKLELESLGFEIEGGVFTTRLSGKVTPLFRADDFDWPAFQVKELTIDSHSNVHLDGGWIDLPKQYSLDFYGFTMEITKLGLGKTDDGGKWIGFSGNLKLVDDFPNCGSVEGLRIIWYDEPGKLPRITFNGVGVEFEKKGIVSFKGAVAYRELEEAGKKIHRFDGAISLKLPMLKGVEIAATLVFGSESGPQGNYTFFAIYAAGEFPKGIPLFGTNLGIYGVAGLFALNMEPDKHADEEWFEGWYKRPQIGVTDIKNKWTNRNGSLALGAGATLGTVEDNGYKFSGKFLLAIVFPGPILLIEGKANMLKKRAQLSDDPTFRALAVLDERAGTFLLGLDAHYTKDESGALIDIRGSAEAFFNLNDAGDWHLYLGKDEPRDKRIRAKVFKGLYQPAGYFMLDPKELRMGIWYGWDKQWKFSRLSVVLQAWIESNVQVSWNPNQFQGDLWLHGKAELRAFGRGVGANVDARIEADVFKPYHLLGKFSVGIPLPWPLHRINKNITLEWGPEPTPPELPDPLEGIAIEHLKATTSWILQFGDSKSAPPRDKIPVVPLDSRPHITFSRSMNDDSLVAVNAQPGDSELIGDPAKGGIARARYALTGVALHKWDSMGWTLVASKGTTSVSTASDPAEKLYGSWAPVPAEGDIAGEKVGQTKLWIWSKTPFDYARHTQRSWDEWFTTRFKRYPCIDIRADRVICCNFQNVSPSTQLRSPWVCSDQPSIILSWLAPASLPVTVLNQPMAGLSHALCLPGVIPNPAANQHNRLTISLLEPAKSVEIHVAQKQNLEDRVCINFEAGRLRDGPNPRVEQVFGFTEAVRFEVRDGSGTLLDQTTIDVEETHLGSFSAFDCEFETEITLPCEASVVDLIITLTAVPVTITAFNENGSAVETVFPQLGFQQCDYQPIPIRLIGGVKRIVIRTEQGETGLQEICFQCGGGARISTTALDTNRRQYGPIITTSETITVAGEDLRSVQIESSAELCILQVCATIGPDAAEVAGREAMAQHLQEEMERWSQLDEVLEPNTSYRIAVGTTVDAEPVDKEKLKRFKNYPKDKTQFAYFRTEGPPGLAKLSLPDGAPDPKEFVLRNKDGKIITVDDNDVIGQADTLEQVNTAGKTHPRAILKSDLNDLTSYVKQTIPPTIANTGKPFLPRPVYRAYDVGVEFNENYVESIYRKARRDLGLYLYDNNNQPVRDAQGRLIVLNNRWGVSKSHTLDESEGRWISLIKERNCASIDPSVIPHESTLTSEAEGQVLDADTVYEARLVPLLMHDDSPVDLAGWSVVGDSSHWTVQGHRDLKGHAATVSGQVVSLDGVPDLSVLDTSKDVILLDDDPATSHGLHRILSYDDRGPVRTVEVDGTPTLTGSSTSWRIPARGTLAETSGKETTLVAGNPEWKDYRFSATVRSTTDNRVGVAFRWNEAGDNYSLVIDPTQKTAQLFKVIHATPQLLKTATADFTQDADYLIAVEAIGSVFQAYIDGLLVLSATDSEITSGGIALYSGGDPIGTVRTKFDIRPVVRFSDVRVDDFSSDAPVVYSFKFTTSRYANFFHHVHSYQDETWSAESNLTVPSSGEEGRAFEALFSQLPTQPTQTKPAQVMQNPTEVQVTRIRSNGPPIAFLVQSPEPLDWSRVTLEVRRAPEQSVPLHAPGAVKLTDVSFGARASDESITLLLREPADLSGYRIEYNHVGNPIDETTWKPYFAFGFEERIAAGTRVRIYSGNQLSVPTAEPAVLRRFVATGSDQGELRFSTSGVYLRVTAPDGITGHARPFLPPSAYIAIDPGDLQLIRKADGTAFFLITTAGFSAGELRVAMTYVRDKGNSDPSSPVLSEAGYRGAEIVTMDIPWRTTT